VCVRAYMHAAAAKRDGYTFVVLVPFSSQSPIPNKLRRRSAYGRPAAMRPCTCPAKASFSLKRLYTYGVVQVENDAAFLCVCAYILRCLLPSIDPLYYLRWWALAFL
jgi:hypothetical protein